MAKLGTYRLARVLKMGSASAESVARTILNPTVVPSGRTKWTILDGRDFVSEDQTPFFFGKLTKFHPEADVSVANLVEKIEESRSEPNLIAATSPFIYIPKYSGITFLDVSNHIRKDKFFKIFPALYGQTASNILDNIELEAITDLRNFYLKINSLDKITSIDAKVYPPNPMFGILWRKLKEYLEERDAKSLKLTEQGKESGINSNLQSVIAAVLEQDQPGIEQASLNPSISDAAILMAADGYGYGTVLGEEEGRVIPVTTYDSTRSFRQESDAEPIALFNTASGVFRRIEEERHMEHPNNEE